MALTDMEREALDSIVARRARLPAHEVRARKAVLARSEISLVQRGAAEHPNARVRRECLAVLDHHASDESVDVFRAVALHDPIPHVRVVALHGLACERCRMGTLCVEDTVTDLVTMCERDDNPKVRHAAIFVLARLADRDARARSVLERIAERDDDALVRQVAGAAADGRRHDVKSRKALRRRARARTVRR